jgi:hypothetical protein
MHEPGVHWTARYSNLNGAGERLERLHRVVSELRGAPATACAVAVPRAAESAPAPEPLGDVEQLRVALEECGSVPGLSRQSGHPVEQVRALVEAEGLIGPKLRRRSLSDEQLHRAGRDYEAGATLRELAKNYAVGTTYLRLHLTRAGVPMRPSGGRPSGRQGQPAAAATARWMWPPFS